ncbi:hypothetical protein LguiA_016317 [Lonicera macranthoides]
MWLELGGHIRIGRGGGAYAEMGPTSWSNFLYPESRGQSGPSMGPQVRYSLDSVSCDAIIGLASVFASHKLNIAHCLLMKESKRVTWNDDVSTVPRMVELAKLPWLEKDEVSVELPKPKDKWSEESEERREVR